MTDVPTRLEVFVLDRSALVAAVGTLNSRSAARLADCLGGLHGDVTVDLTGVTALDADCISVLLRQRLRLARSGSRLSLVGPQVPVRRLLRSAGISGWIVDHLSCPDERPSQAP